MRPFIFEGQLKLELGIVGSSFLGHRSDPPLAWVVIVFSHLNLWSSVWCQL